MPDLSRLDPAIPTLLGNLRVPSGFVPGCPAGITPDRDGVLALDLVLKDGRIADLGAAGTLAAETRIDMEGRHVWPFLVDVHTHLDKGHIVERAPNPTGDHAGARDATAADRKANWRHDDLVRRMEFGLMSAEAHGVAAIRTHLDSQEGQAEETWAAFAEMRDRWAGRVALQGVALVPVDAFRTDYGRKLADIVAAHGGLMGGVTRSAGGTHGAPLPDIDQILDTIFSLAAERGLDVDLHVDEAAQAASLAPVAEATLRHGYEGRVTCGHCCSLALYPGDEAARVIALVAKAGISIVTLPTVNMYLQDRQPGRTPRWRGVTPVTELRAAGVRVAVAGDNCRDPFYAYGDHDMLDTYRQGVRILHGDHPWGLVEAMAGPVPADMMGLGRAGRIGTGSPADLMVFEAWSMDQVIARPQSDRRLIRGGRDLAVRAPSYAWLTRHAG